MIFDDKYVTHHNMKEEEAEDALIVLMLEVAEKIVAKLETVRIHHESITMMCSVDTEGLAQLLQDVMVGSVKICS